MAVSLFTLAPRYVTVVSIVPDHLLSLVGDMRGHGGTPFEGIEVLLLFSIFGLVGSILKTLWREISFRCFSPARIVDPNGLRN